MSRFTEREYEDMCHEMVGKRFSHLTVTEYLGVQKSKFGKHGNRMLKARCDCGNEFTARASDVRLGKLKRCSTCSRMLAKHTTICWNCAKATNLYLCPWAGGKPRDDWDAEEAVIDGMNTWSVRSCPGFKRG